MIVTQIPRFPFLAPAHSSFAREEHLLFLDVLPLDPRAHPFELWRIHTYVRSRGCRWTRSHQEEVKKRERARARWGKGFRPQAAEVWNDRGGLKEAEEDEEEERSPGSVDRCSGRIEWEAIRECLMPHTKLCNYLYVRLRPS